jgi:hypothetical protein
VTIFSRRHALLATLFGAGGLGLRALATGLPSSFLANPRRTLAAGGPCATPQRAQYFIFSTSAAGDPINAGAPGTYDDPKITHSPDPALAPRPISLRGTPVQAAAPWATLPQRVLDRTVFWHLMTDTPVHSKEPDVLKLMGASPAREMLPSLLARALAPCLGTVQRQPITVGALTPSESLSADGAALPIIPPLALRATLANPAGPLQQLQALRASTLDQIYGLYKDVATPAQRRHMDDLLTSQRQVRSIRQDLLDALSSIKDNSPAAQVRAAVTLISMNVSPVVAIHIPFGGDNHRDPNLATETAETISGVATIAALMEALAAAGLEDRVTFATLNVFGRTLGPGMLNGRSHNANHQVSITIGKPFRGGVVGGVAPMEVDYGALAIDARTGAGRADGDIHAVDSLACYARTLLAAIGADGSGIIAPGGSGKVIDGALA